MRILTISSPANPLVKEAIKIRERRGHYRRAAFLIEGPHLAETALLSSRATLEKVFFTAAFSEKREGRELLRRIRHDAFFAREGILAEITDHLLSQLADTETPQGIVAVVSCEESGLESLVFTGTPFLVVADAIRDPGNLGALIRVSDAAGADAVILLPGSCDAFSQKVVRATAGSLFNIPLVQSLPEDVTLYLAENKIALVVADVGAETSVFNYDFSGPTAVAFGNEAHGAGKILMQSASDLVKIPLLGGAESLNVAQSAAVILYETVRQRLYSRP